MQLPERVPYAIITGTVVVIGGSATMLGWWLEIVRFTDWFGTGVSMMPNAAIAFFFLGSSLILAGHRRKAAILPALVTFAIGAATFLEHVFQIDLGIDRLVIDVEWGQAATTVPGRMGLPASSMFILSSSALLFFQRNERSIRKMASMAAVACVFIALLSIVGYIYGVASFYLIPRLTAISFSTAILFVVLAAGIISIYPDVQPLRILRSNTAAGAMVRRALPLLIIGPIIIGWSILVGQQNELYDAEFGTAMRTVVEVIVLLAVLWWMARAVEKHERSLRISENALKASEERYRTFIHNSSEGIWRIELEQPIDTTLAVRDQIELAYRHGILAECNDAMARMYGFEKAEELIGIRLGEIMPRTPENLAYLEAFMNSGYNLHGGESEERDRNGEPVFFSNNLVGIIEDGYLLRAWGTQSNITEQRLTEVALREADRRKDDFLATLAHELRNPLSPIVSGTELLGLGADQLSPQDAKNIHGMVQRQLQHMVRLIDDLMDVSRINRGKIELRLEKVELAPILHNAIEACRPILNEYRHTLRIGIPDEKLEMHGDPVRLAQVFSNVLNNAAKYTDEGGEISITVQKNYDDVIVSITDNGIGLAEEDIPKIFEMFGQVDRSTTRTSTGLGIGLALVRRLVEKHNGQVDVKSDGLGKGTTFAIRLPLVKPLVMA